MLWFLQLELGKRESMLASAEIEGLKSYHFKETHEFQDQLLSQRSVVSKLTLRLQEALQVTILSLCAYSEVVPLALHATKLQQPSAGRSPGYHAS